MSVSVRPKMTAEEFLDWKDTLPKEQHYELLHGEVYAMVSERVRHARAKFAIAIVLREAIARAGLSCEAFVDSMSVRVDAETVFEPDGFVRCGKRLDGDVISVDDPVIVVEVVSPSTSRIDADHKFVHYFLIPTVQHYLIMDAKLHKIVHHRRAERGDIASRIIAAGPIVLDPPGIDVPNIFADLA